MSDLDGFMESRDPFYVPDLIHERVAFVGSASLFAAPIIMPILLGRAPASVMPSFVMVLFAGLALVGGLRSRAYRLKRMRVVAELRAGGAKHLEKQEAP
ncbi:hypothetical protein [Altererythrobacter sp. Root672]|uniref:hypothetical protein n=1 Tax=Altererythrobacter sp. Root672 TaxID=1736584 RepID=UPI0012E3B40B|nr:hypothetical protein [Altererythrobacter sp. Root672]